MNAREIAEQIFIQKMATQYKKGEYNWLEPEGKAFINGCSYEATRALVAASIFEKTATDQSQKKNNESAKRPEVAFS
jgi:hypothetical protein